MLVNSLKVYFSVIFICLNSTIINGQETKNSINTPIFDVNNWQHLDLEANGIMGISLDKTYSKILKKSKATPIIVAVIDSYIDSSNPDIIHQIWKNTKEIPNNGIDDDDNGYIDDIQGWNFMGNRKGDCVAYLNTDSQRRLKLLYAKYKDSVSIKKNKNDSIRYSKALASQKNQIAEHKQIVNAQDYYSTAYPAAMKRIQEFFPNGNYTLKEIDSLSVIYKDSKDTAIQDDLYFIKNIKAYNLDVSYFKKFAIKADYLKNTLLNPNYNDRKIIGDNENDINDHNYGNPFTWKLPELYAHNTYMTGVIAGNRNNTLGAKGIMDTKIKIIPITIMPDEGSMTDKDLHYAIKYAVDNGAKVINMSFGKLHPIYPEWIKQAIIYAAKKDVLLVVSAGNDRKNIDLLAQYPNDYDFENFIKGKEYVKNLIVVAGNTPHANQNLVYESSNYGKRNVDVFAPASEIKTIEVFSGEHIGEGTSYSAAITSGLAALIRSHYPKLTAEVVKKIIMDSAIKLDLMVQVPGEKEGVLKPFSELSKSGGVVNAYNAMLMAKEKNKRIKQSNVFKKN
ncbi:S8 family serine peptidase [Flavobacterium columnare]|uniref:S8 family serine peptidase n=2 Tax=Flavobacterium TaxID=237 RepID=A0ABW8PRX0_9FLAO|nr:S8 family serine peptidase [Flavobacterium columnare]SPE78065.1 Cell wall-associated protease precursor [Flavobacterium columnare]